MTLRLRFRIGRQEAVDCPDPIFGTVLSGGGPKAGSLGASLAVHVLLVFLVALVSHHLASQEYQMDWSRYDLEMIRLRIAEPLYFSAAKAGNLPKARPTPPGTPSNGASEPAGEGAPQASGSRLPRRLDLPVPRRAASNAPVLIQPELRPQLPPPPTDLPPMAFWARRDPEPPQPKPRSQEVVPGRKEAPSAAPKLAAPPSPAVPNREQAVAEINVSLPPPPPTQLPLSIRLPNSATMPVRLRDAKESEAASFDRAAGQSVNVIALASERNDIRNVAVPKGVQNIPTTSAGEGPATPAGDGAGGASGAPSTVTANGSAGANQSGKASPQANPGNRGTSTAPGAGAAQDRAATNSASAKAQAGASTRADANAADSPSPAALGSSAPARSAGAPTVTRIEHPLNGNFDVVIMQSAMRDDLLSQGVTLTGNPVYSVYLRVGDQKEWLLEYCVPAAQNLQANPYQINVDDAGAITPPYPISTVIPNSVLGQAIPKHLVVHGFLSDTGNLRGIKAPDPGNPLMAEILAFLSQWQFRPAFRNKKPIDVEILLVIPARG